MRYKSRKLIYLPALILLTFVLACNNQQYHKLPRAKAIQRTYQVSKQVQKSFKSDNRLLLIPGSDTSFREKETYTPLPANGIMNKSLDKKDLTRDLKKNINHSSSIPFPDDSIEVDIAKETKLAEKLGNIGYTLGIIGLSSMLAYLGFLVFIPGFLFSAIAFYKMSTYELEVNNRKKIMTGFIINTIGLVLLAALIALIYLLVI